MSSSYPPFGNAPTRPCQRCGMPLPLNEVYCGNCGQYNTVAQAGKAVVQPSSGISWGVSPQTAYGQNQNGAQQWGQPPVQPGQSTQNNPFDGYTVPQQPFNSPAQPYQPYQSIQPQQAQQPSNFNNFYGTSSPSFYRQPTTGEFPPGSINGYPPSDFAQPPAQPVTGGFPPGNINGYQSSGFGQPLTQPTTGGFPPGAMNGYPPAASAQASASKSGPRIGMIIGIIVLLLIVVGGSIGGYVYLKKQSATPTAQVTPSVAPTSTPKGTPLFSDSFANNRNGWDTTSKSGEFSVKIGSGSLVLEDDNNKLLWELVPGGRNFKDFFLSTNALLSQGSQDNGYGIYIRGASNQNVDIATYYRFELYGDGTFAVFKGTVDASGTSKSALLVNYTTSSAIHKQGQINRIAISAKGSTISFSVNGQSMATISDNSYTSGSVALFVSNLPNTTAGAQATFTNFVIYPPQS